MSEFQYFGLLENLARSGGMLVPVAADMSQYSRVAQNQAEQTDLIRTAALEADGSAREECKELADIIGSLPAQLYIETTIRLEMAWRVIRASTLRYALTAPGALGIFRWRFDRKGQFEKTRFEKAYSPFVFGQIRNLAERDPLKFASNGNYHNFERFLKPGSALPSQANAGRILFDGRKLLLEDVKFVDSASESGVQVADLVVSGIRACIRGEFRENDRAARLLGRLIYRASAEDTAVLLVNFGPAGYSTFAEPAASALQLLHDSAAVMLCAPPGPRRKY